MSSTASAPGALDRAGTLLSRNAERHLKAPADLAAMLSDLPEAVEPTLVIADRCRFTLAERDRLPLLPGRRRRRGSCGPDGLQRAV